MSSSAWLATTLDLERLASGTRIFPSHTPLHQISARFGHRVAPELGYGCLVRYLLPSQIRSFTEEVNGEYETKTTHGQWTTPTPYSPQEAVRWLALPDPDKPRRYAFIINPKKLKKTPDGNDRKIKGPRRVRLGGGIEYYLTKGFNEEALIEPWPIPVR